MKISELLKSGPEIRWRLTFVGALIFGVIILSVLGGLNHHVDEGRHFIAGFILAAAALAVGAFLGFLFGIPRSQQGELSDKDRENGLRSYAENTNLEQISDWLTKIIVGLTLVQFREIIDYLDKIGGYFGPAIIKSDSLDVQKAVSVAIIIYFLIIGFMFLYLWTRIYVETLFQRQSALLKNELEDLLDDRDEQNNDKDGLAIELTDAYLDEKSDINDQKFANVRERVAASSLMARALIFDRAKKARKEAWAARDILELEKTIPIFRGLIDAAPNRYHRNYGQLGYALTRANEPDWKEAKAILEKAIELRGENVKTSGTGYYEFDLAIALINLDRNFKAKTASDATDRKRIVNLLDKAKPFMENWDEPVILKWSKLNNYAA